MVTFQMSVPALWALQFPFSYLSDTGAFCTCTNVGKTAIKDNCGCKGRSLKLEII